MSLTTIILIIAIALALIISQLNTFRKNAKQPLRKKSLNELTETLPRSQREKKHKKST
jgi:uncharacterized alpha/beta hydrolase family protein